MSAETNLLWLLAEGAVALSFGVAWLRAMAEKQRQANAADLYLRGYQALAAEARKNAPAAAEQADVSLLKRRLAAVADQLFIALALMDEWDREQLICLSPDEGDVSSDVRVKMRGALAYAGYPVPQAGQLPVVVHAGSAGKPVARWQCDDCGADIGVAGQRLCRYCSEKEYVAAQGHPDIKAQPIDPPAASHEEMPQ